MEKIKAGSLIKPIYRTEKYYLLLGDSAGPGWQSVLATSRGKDDDLVVILEHISESYISIYCDLLSVADASEAQ